MARLSGNQQSGNKKFQCYLPVSLNNQVVAAADKHFSGNVSKLVRQAIILLLRLLRRLSQGWELQLYNPKTQQTVSIELMGCDFPDIQEESAKATPKK